MTCSRTFEDFFTAATGHPPFPWQAALYERFLADRHDNIPPVCDIPTGLGKTSVVAIWLIALADRPEKIPRRLVYVVNRRTVVDQTTSEVEKLRRHLNDKPKLKPLRDKLGTLAISTLRGQFADNGEWFADPSRPAVICGTVDMIGSRLLFSGYRIGFKSKPLHAGFMGQDVLLVHDEAHLEPAFQQLVERIEAEQKREGRQPSASGLPWPSLQVMALSATARTSTSGSGDSDETTTLRLSNVDRKHPVVKKRIEAAKQLSLHPIRCHDDKGKEKTPGDIHKEVLAKIVELVQSQGESSGSVLVFLRGVEDVDKVAKELPDQATERLTGTLRGFERDQLVRKPVFQRFLAPKNRDPDLELPGGTVYLVCTSAGEVGVNISADHLVCDLSTFDSMAQRFGRVNRFGDRDDTQIHVVHPDTLKVKDKISPVDQRRENTLVLLKKLGNDASPAALESLDPDEKKAAFAPEPTILPATDILFDNWAMTTIRGKMPGRPPVEPYLHGVAEWEPPRTEVAWRDEVEIITGDLLTRYPPAELLEAFPLKPHEVLQDRSDRVLKVLKTIAKRAGEEPVWLVQQDGSVESMTLKQLANKEPKDRINGVTVLLPPCVGGLRGGMLDGSAKHEKQIDYDISHQWHDEKGANRRIRLWDDETPPGSMALIRTLDIKPGGDEFEPVDYESEEASEESAPRQFWHWYVTPRNTDEVTRASIRPIRLEHHTCDVVERLRAMIEPLNLNDNLKEALVLVAELHDLGKRRELWQRGIGNPNPGNGSWYAKPGKPADGLRWRPRRISSYRHEFGSLLDILDPDQEFRSRFESLSADMQELVLHIIAAHHGRARPHFPPDEAIDPAPGSVERARAQREQTPRRFARLQRRYGRWGLAYLESLLRAADWAASAEPSDAEENNR